MLLVKKSANLVHSPALEGIVWATEHHAAVSHAFSFSASRGKTLAKKYTMPGSLSAVPPTFTFASIVVGEAAESEGLKTSGTRKLLSQMASNLFECAVPLIGSRFQEMEDILSTAVSIMTTKWELCFQGLSTIES